MKVLFIYPKNEYGQIVRVADMKEFFCTNAIPIKEFEAEFTYTREPKASRFIKHLLDSRLFKDYDHDYSLNLNFNSDDMLTYRIRVFEKKLAEMDLDWVKNYNWMHAENHHGALIAYLLKERYQIPYIFDVHGLEYEEAKGMNQKLTDQLYIKKLERLVLQNAEYLIVVSNAMKMYINAHYKIPLEKIIVVPCCSGPVPIKKASYKKKLKVIYAGGLGYFENVETYLELAKLNPHDNIEFYFAGGISQELCNKLKASKIKYLGTFDRAEIMELLTEMSVGVAPSSKDIARLVASPLKIIDYVTSGLPVITVNSGEWSDLIRYFDAGFVCNNSDAKEFLTSLEKLMDEAVWDKKSRNALELSQKVYNKASVFKPLLDLYQGLD